MGLAAPKASASCRWTASRQQSRTRSNTPRARECAESRSSRKRSWTRSSSPMPDAPTVEIVVEVNGRRAVVRTHPMARLLDVLRQDLHLTGTKEGCGEGECGACSVIVNGELVNSCLMPALQADGAAITTI